MMSAAFIGVSLDSVLFSREWVRLAFRHVLPRHDRLLFVLADRLLAYNKTALISTRPISLDFESARLRMDQRSRDITKFLDKEIALLAKPERERVQVAHWADYSDSVYADLHRKLRIAYSAVGLFRTCVDLDASIHFERHLNGFEDRSLYHELCVSYVLDETAMDIRITELTSHSFEYYPEQHIQTLTALYEGKFREFGLSVQQLIEAVPRRVFQPLPINVEISTTSAESLLL